MVARADPAQRRELNTPIAGVGLPASSASCADKALAPLHSKRRTNRKIVVMCGERMRLAFLLCLRECNFESGYGVLVYLKRMVSSTRPRNVGQLPWRLGVGSVPRGPPCPEPKQTRRSQLNAVTYDAPI